MNARRSSPFSIRTVLGLVLFGAIAFLAMLYFIGAGDTGKGGNDGRAHAASNGLNGFSGFAKLLELEGYDVNVSRSPSGLDTYGLLVLTPPSYFDAEELAELLEKREDYGPTIVILPKWYASQIPKRLPKKVREQMDVEIKDGWVRLNGAQAGDWTKDLPSPYGFTSTGETLEADDGRQWEGMGLSGKLPSGSLVYAESSSVHEPLVSDAAGHVLALSVLGEEGSDYYENAHWALFVVEPDLLNNYGLAQAVNAQLATAIIDYVRHQENKSVTFDLTLNGFGGEANLLTLAFTPPFLAATLCMILALLVIAWRAFMRFGPARAEGPAIAFGKQRLIANGAGLILRGRRFGLLTTPYVALMARRLQARLGLVKPDHGMIDQALAHRLPQDEPFTNRAVALRKARRPSEILRAAEALHELERKLIQ